MTSIYIRMFYCGILYVLCCVCTILNCLGLVYLSVELYCGRFSYFLCIILYYILLYVTLCVVILLSCSICFVKLYAV